MFEEFGDDNKVTPAPFPRIAFADSMAKYGTDTDLRNPIEMADVTEKFHGSGLIFAGMIEKDDKVRVYAIPAPTGGAAPL